VREPVCPLVISHARSGRFSRHSLGLLLCTAGSSGIILHSTDCN